MKVSTYLPSASRTIHRRASLPPSLQTQKTRGRRAPTHRSAATRLRQTSASASHTTTYTHSESPSREAPLFSPFTGEPVTKTPPQHPPHHHYHPPQTAAHAWAERDKTRCLTQRQRGSHQHRGSPTLGRVTGNRNQGSVSTRLEVQAVTSASLPRRTTPPALMSPGRRGGIVQQQQPASHDLCNPYRDSRSFRDKTTQGLVKQSVYRYQWEG